jgi:hypothetical protein
VFILVSKKLTYNSRFETYRQPFENYIGTGKKRKWFEFDLFLMVIFNP